MDDEEEFEDFDGDGDWCDHCNGLGTVTCKCGGDICICLNNGEKECPARCALRKRRTL